MGPVAGYPAGGGRTIRVVMADAAPVFRRGLHVAFSLDRDLQIVGEAGDHGKAIAAVRGTAPDVVLLDINLPGLDQVGVGWAGVRTLLPRLKICLLMTADNASPQAVASKLAHLGTAVDGYLSKAVGLEDITAAVRSVWSGQPVLSPALAPLLVPTLQGHAGSATASPLVPVIAQSATAASMGVEVLTDREMDVLRLLAEGLPNRLIAERLFISENTVRNHVRHILDKLRVRSRTEAALYAVRANVIDLAVPARTVQLGGTRTPATR